MEGVGLPTLHFMFSVLLVEFKPLTVGWYPTVHRAGHPLYVPSAPLGVLREASVDSTACIWVSSSFLGQMRLHRWIGMLEVQIVTHCVCE